MHIHRQVSRNQIEDAHVTVVNGGSRVIFSITAATAGASFPALTPSIKAEIVYERDISGSWVLSRSSSRTTPYPSLGIYRKTANGFQTIDEYNEEWLGFLPHLFWTRELARRTRDSHVIVSL